MVDGRGRRSHSEFSRAGGLSENVRCGAVPAAGPASESEAGPVQPTAVSVVLWASVRAHTLLKCGRRDSVTVAQDSSKGGAVKTGCSDLYDIIY